jgi:hypothetical protein
MRRRAAGRGPRTAGTARAPGTGGLRARRRWGQAGRGPPLLLTHMRTARPWGPRRSRLHPPRRKSRALFGERRHAELSLDGDYVDGGRVVDISALRPRPPLLNPAPQGVSPQPRMLEPRWSRRHSAHYGPPPEPTAPARLALAGQHGRRAHRRRQPARAPAGSARMTSRRSGTTPSAAAPESDQDEAAAGSGRPGPGLWPELGAAPGSRRLRDRRLFRSIDHAQRQTLPFWRGRPRPSARRTPGRSTGLDAIAGRMRSRTTRPRTCPRRSGTSPNQPKPAETGKENPSVSQPLTEGPRAVWTIRSPTLRPTELQAHPALTIHQPTRRRHARSLRAGVLEAHDLW